MRNFRQDVFALLILAAITIGQGFYAAKLNVDFYKEHAPFFDSCSYANQLAIVAAETRSSGLALGIKNSLSGNVALPFLEMNLLANAGQPSRVTGVWLQSVWMIVLALSLYWYFARYRMVQPWLAVLLTLPFISFARVYDWNGGLSDFRMDLSLYIFVSLTAVWYLATYETESRLPWILAGFAAMLACLARATSPVYLLLMLGPLFVARLVARRANRRALLTNALLMCIPLGIAIGAFLIHNFSYLFYYYVTWGADENRHLPWSESVTHFRTAASHVGEVLKWCALAAMAIHAGCVRKRFPAVDWKLIWLAAAAPLFLAVRGAGINPFVTMPAVFGFLMFACFPFKGMPPAFRYRWAGVAIGIILAGGALESTTYAFQPQIYTGISVTSMPGVRALIDRASQDASSRGLPRVEFIAPELGDCHSCMISDILTYEYHAMPVAGKALAVPGGLTYHFPEELTFTASDELFWDKVPGKSEQEKVQSVAAMMEAQSPAYLLLPDDDTLKWLEEARSMYYINRKTRELRSRLLATGKWVSLGEPVQVDANERIEVFAPRNAGHL